MRIFLRILAASLGRSAPIYKRRQVDGADVVLQVGAGGEDSRLFAADQVLPLNDVAHCLENVIAQRLMRANRFVLERPAEQVVVTACCDQAIGDRSIALPDAQPRRREGVAGLAHEAD